jgi:AraC-like DNA-binding protein
MFNTANFLAQVASLLTQIASLPSFQENGKVERMRSDTLLAALPDLSARIMHDELVNQFSISWASFCNYHHLKPLSFESGTRDLLAEEELQLQRAFAEATSQSAYHWLRMGLRYRSMKYGTFGLAMMTARTLGEGLTLACRYQELTYSLITYRFAVNPNQSCAMIGEDLTVPKQLRHFSQYRDLGAIRTLIADLTGGSLPLEEVCVAAPPPPDWSSIESLFPCRVQFNADQTQWRFKPGTANSPLPLADMELMLLYSSKCEGLLKAARSNASISQRLAAMLDIALDRFPSASEAADRLALSERTLHRRLADEGTKFSSLIDSARYKRACELLADKAMSVEAIAAAMGFAEPSSFSRAFKRWSGMGSFEFRRQLNKSAKAN